MTQIARNLIRLDGWDPNWIFNGLTLRQPYNDHHVFEVSVLVPQPEKKAVVPPSPALQKDALLNLLGKDIEITLSAKGKSGATGTFRGFVDRVTPVWTSKACILRITGYSKTIFMDTGPRFRSFYKKPLGDIAQKIAGSYGSQLPKLVLRSAGNACVFSVQTQETDYRYLCRLADGYGKLFYYDGQQLYFGDLEKGAGSALPLKFGEDLKQASLSLNITPLNFSLSAYQLEDSRLETYRCVNEWPHADALVSGVVQKSGIYPASDIHLVHVIHHQSELRGKAAHLLAKQAHDVVQLSGASDLPSLKIGSKISITGTPELLANGEFIVINVNHSVNNDYSYSNTFWAVPAGFPFAMRMQNTRNPLCGPLMAIVRDHRDPDKLGRVRVEFIGDPEKTLSPWLRVLTSYTGFGGMYFQAEPNDEVVVQAEGFDIEKYPFVSGAFFHGKARAEQWYDADNKKKGFTTEKVAFRIDDRTGKLLIEADEIEFSARKEMLLRGERQLTLKATRIDLNP
ncbi:MAG: hypothetical protein IPM81_12830 [Saprospirales bacterium]|nr:hypothetical protein [Saprospirales bacterium]